MRQTEDAEHRGSPQNLPFHWGRRGGSGIITTVVDLDRWYRALRRGDLCSATAVESMFAPATSVSARVAHSGTWYLIDTPRGARYAGHGGDDDAIGHNAALIHDLDADVLVIVLSNGGLFSGVPAAQFMSRHLVELVREQPPTLPPLPALADGNAAAIETCEGVYQGASATLTLWADGGGELWFGVDGQEAVDGMVPGAAEERAQRNAFTEAVFRGLARDDLSPLATAVRDPDLLAMYTEFLRRWWASVQGQYGGFRNITILGTAPAWWDPNVVAATWARLAFDDAVRIVRVEWGHDGAPAQLGGSAIPHPILGRLRLRADGRWPASLPGSQCP